MFSKGFGIKKILYEKLLSMCVMYVYVHLAHNTILDYVLSIMIFNDCVCSPLFVIKGMIRLSFRID
jgi:hypothetical protein